jgi:Arc/MetJ-type ribon-helix-helix transcriptional regulator
MAPFNYSMEAELYSGFARALRRQTVGYRRFASAAEAIRFAIEELSAESLAGAALEVGDQRFDSHGIRRLYEASDYPLPRRKREARGSAAMPRTPQAGRPVPGSGAAKRRVPAPRS